MTPFYLDTEFNGHGGQLISLALVSVTARWYGVVELPHKIEPWVAINVIPVLGDVKPLPYKAFKAEFQRFLSKLRCPTIICDWYADAMHFLALLEGHDYASSLDFECKIHVLKTPPVSYSSKLPHNAEADAEALMRWHNVKGPFI